MLNALFTPYTLRGKEIKNRCVVSAMVTNYCTEDGKATEQWLNYHEEKAKGGWGVIITEDYAVDPLGRSFSHVAGLWSDDQIESHSELPKRVHQYGSKVLAQIFHAGRNTSSRVTGATPVAPSAIPDTFGIEVPRALTTAEVRELVKKFGDTAYRAKVCGFDGVEIHCGHGYLLCEFMSAHSNKRTDEYGGSLLNRCRMPIEIIKEIRARCGEDFIICLKISNTEMVEGGRTLQETKAIVPYLEEAGLDIINVSVANDDSGQYIVPASYVDHAWLADAAEEIKKVCHIPVITVGRINDPVLANSVIASGKADFVAMGRASLCDPALPNKAKAGEFEEIRHCIGCDYGCIGLLGMDQPITCVLNPTLGKEKEWMIKPAEAPKKVAIIGAGPAGLEAAIVAKQAGHTVTVYEKDAVAGGKLNVAAVPPCKGEIADFIRWQTLQCEKLDIPIRYNTKATVELMKSEAPDVILLATGAEPFTPPINGADLPHVVMANDLLAGKVMAGPRAVVIGGGSVGAEVANFLAINAFRSVSVVEMRPYIALEDAAIARFMLLESLAKKNVQCYTEASVTEITENVVKVHTAQKDFEIGADTVILATGSKPENQLKPLLEDAGFTVRVLGDAVKIGNIMNATADGYQAALDL